MDSEPASNLSKEATPPAHKGPRFNPWLFFGVLVVPGIVSIFVLTQDSSDYGETAFITLLITSIVAGLVCGIHFTLAQRTMTTGLKVVIGIVSVIGCAGASFALGFGGCYLFVLTMESL